MNTFDSKLIRVFVASPGDVTEERDTVALVVAEVRRMLATVVPYALEAVRWETHAWPDVGADAQDVINHEIGEFDIFVGVMWRRFGTPTKRAASGTDEEFKRAFSFYKKYGRPKIMFYFRRSPFYPESSAELTQVRKVLQFQNDLEKLGVLYWTYIKPLEFERQFREHLVRQVLSLKPPESETVSISDEQPKPAKKRTKKKTAKKTPPKPEISLPRKWPTVFIAYAHDDRSTAVALARSLRLAGIEPWLDVEKLLPGQRWMDQIKTEIEKASAVLLLLSDHSISKKGYFQKEIRTAIDMAKKQSKSMPYLVPVRITPIEMTRELSSYQVIDLFDSASENNLVRFLHNIFKLDASACPECGMKRKWMTWDAIPEEVCLNPKCKDYEKGWG